MWSNQYGELISKHFVLTHLFKAKPALDCKYKFKFSWEICHIEIELLRNAA